MPSNAVDAKHKLYDRNRETYETIDACVEGEQAVKAGGTRWLPEPNAHESSSHNADVRKAAERRYTSYRTRARFLNATGRTLNGMLGIVFGEPVSTKLSGPLEGLSKDADGKGQPLTQVLRDITAEVLKSGRGYVLADYTGSGEVTAANKGEPRLRLFYGTQIINWRETKGRTSLVVLKYVEDVEDNDGFTNVERTVWLELRMVDGVACARQWTSLIDTATGGVNSNTVTELVPLTDLSGNALDELPGAWLGSVNNDSYPDPAPLGDIAMVNIGHYQADADVVEAARIVGQPTLVLTGLTQAWVDDNLKGGITVGATSGISLGTGMDAKILQASETNASTALKDQRAKEMAMLGAKLLERGSAAKTATQADYEAQTDNSILSLCAGNVERAVNKSLELLARMVGGSGTVELNKKYGMADIDANVLTALMAQVQGGTLSLHNLIRYQQKVGLVSPDESPEKIEDDLRSQNPLPGVTGLGSQTDSTTEEVE